MKTARIVIWTFSIAFIVLSTGVVFGQGFPSKPIRIVTGGVGGGNDVLARLIARGLTSSLDQQVIVDNRPSGLVPGEIVARASPDGYTIGLSGRSFWIGPFFLSGKWPYHPIKDFSPITIPTTTPNILVVHPSLPVKSVKELIALAKNRPGELNHGSSGIGSGAHIAFELFKGLAHVNIVHINYRGMGAAYADLMAGQVQMAFGSLGGVKPHIQSGRLRALAVTSAQPSALLPGFPTVAASGLPGYEFESPFAIYAPAETPRSIVDRLNKEIVEVLKRPDVKEKLFKSGIGEVVGSSPEQLKAMLQSDMVRLGKLIKEAGLQRE